MKDIIIRQLMKVQDDIQTFKGGCSEDQMGEIEEAYQGVQTAIEMFEGL